MTTLALPERWTFAGVDLSSYAQFITLVSGADEFPPMRGENSPLSQLPGRRWLPKLYDERRFTLALFVTSRTAADGAGLGGALQARANLDSLYGTLAAGVAGTVARLMPDGTTRTIVAEPVAVRSFADPVNHEAYTLLVDFLAADPLWYGPSTTGPGSQSTAASPKDFAFTPGGSVYTRNLTIDWTGPITGPRITNLTTGEYVDFAGVVVGAAKHLIVSPYLFTATNDGADVAGVLTHAGGFVPWLELTPAAQTLRATATTPGGSVIVTAYPAYI